MPIWTMAIASASIAATYIPLVGQWLVYDRAAIIDGEIWRIVTGHCYHFSALHLWCNLVPLVLIGVCVERRSGLWFKWACLMMATAIGVSLFFARPCMVRFGGVSGLVCGLFAYFGFSGASAGEMRGTVCRITLAVVLLKVGYECYAGDALLVGWDNQGFVVMPMSHGVGCLSALLCIPVQSIAAGYRRQVFRPRPRVGFAFQRVGAIQSARRMKDDFALDLNNHDNFESVHRSDSVNRLVERSAFWMDATADLSMNRPIHRPWSIG